VTRLRLLLIVALVLGLCGTVSAQVAHDGQADVTGTSTAATTLTITGKATAGSDRVGIVSCSWNNETPVIVAASSTWNGVAMTVVDQGAEVTNASLGAGLLRIVNPPTGASNIVIAWDAAATARCVASSYSGVDQTTPVSASNKVATVVNTASPITNTVTTAADEIIVDAVSFTEFDGSETHTVGADQASLQNVTYATFYKALASRQAGSAGGVMSWTFGGGGTGSYVSIAASLKSSGGSAPSVPRLLLLGVGGENE
jgi:hypothetical protein